MQRIKEFLSEFPPELAKRFGELLGKLEANEAAQRETAAVQSAMRAKLKEDFAIEPLAKLRQAGVKLVGLLQEECEIRAALDRWCKEALPASEVILGKWQRTDAELCKEITARLEKIGFSREVYGTGNREHESMDHRFAGMLQHHPEIVAHRREHKRREALHEMLLNPSEYDGIGINRLAINKATVTIKAAQDKAEQLIALL